MVLFFVLALYSAVNVLVLMWEG